MAVNPLTDGLNHRADDDDEKTVVKKEFVVDDDDDKQGKRKKYMEMKDKKSPINKKKKKNKSKQGTPDSAAMIRAQHVQLSLGTESPSFLKLLVRSHVDSCFWMGLPMSFCKSHLPMKDTLIILEDESEEQFEIKYFPKKTGLSAGWRNFAVRHKLRERDVLVFHLVEPSKFKVYIIRANDSSEVDGAPSLLNLVGRAKQNEPGENLGSDDNEDTPTAALKMKRKKPLKSFSHQKKKKRGLVEHWKENDSEEVSLEFSVRSKFSEPTDPCKGLETLEDFHIMVNGLCLDSELHEITQKKYYELCCCKNAFLHDHLLPGLNSKLVAGIISETVNIADAIKACNFATTSQDELQQWEKSLKSFKLLGMNVGFLLSRLRHLVRLAFESEQARSEEEIKNLETKRVELKEAYEKLGADIEKLKSKAERQLLKFQEVVNAPW